MTPKKCPMAGATGDDDTGDHTGGVAEAYTSRQGPGPCGATPGLKGLLPNRLCRWDCTIHGSSDARLLLALAHKQKLRGTGSKRKQRPMRDTG